MGAMLLILEAIVLDPLQPSFPCRDSPPDTDDEVDLRLGRDVEVASSTRSPLQTDLLLLRGKVLLHIGFRALEDDLALGLSSLNTRTTSASSVNRCLDRWQKISPERWYVSGNTVKTKLPLAKSNSMHHKV